MIHVMESDNSAEMSCKDKLAFETKEAASATANVVHYRYGSKVRPYKCRHCGLWHLASS